MMEEALVHIAQDTVKYILMNLEDNGDSLNDTNAIQLEIDQSVNDLAGMYKEVLTLILDTEIKSKKLKGNI